MRSECGSIVRSLKGHDSGEFYAVVKTDEKYAYVANGKTKKLSSPKRKNLKHLCVEHAKKIDVNVITDKVLRKELNIFKRI